MIYIFFLAIETRFRKKKKSVHKRPYLYYFMRSVVVIKIIAPARGLIAGVDFFNHIPDTGKLNTPQ